MTNEKNLMLAMAAKLQPKPAHVIARSIITKENGSDKMFSRLNGGRKKSDPENKWWGKVEIETEYIGLPLGGDYESFVSGAAVRSGAAATKKEVEVEKKHSWHTYENRFFETDRSTRSKFYLKVQASENTMQTAPMVEVRYTYIIEGVRYTRKEAEKVLDGYLKPIVKKAPTSTQIEAGVNAANTIHYYLPKVTDIVYLKQGDYIYTR
jgi:hypothetical protein